MGLYKLMGDDMNNEPVAWIIEDKYGRPALSWKGEPISYNAISVEIEDIPLYTHPAKPIDKPDECIDGCPKNQTCDYCAGIKTLTDEEIIEIRDSCYVQSGIDEWEFDDVVFARAILKKASEK